MDSAQARESTPVQTRVPTKCAWGGADTAVRWILNQVQDDSYFLMQRYTNQPWILACASLVTRGKKPIVALTALMRKIIVIANAKIRDLHLDNKHS